MAHSSSTKKLAEELFRSGKSYNQIASELGVAKGTLSVWLRGVSVDETVQAVKRKRWNSLSDGRLDLARGQRKLNLAQRYSEAELLGVADAESMNSEVAFFAALYAGEGTKSGTSFKFTNANNRYLLFVRDMLESWYGVDASEMKLYIQYHDGGISYVEIAEYWSSFLRIPSGNFNKPTCKKAVSSRQTKYPFGICTLIVNNSLLRHRVLATVNRYIGREAEWLRSGFISRESWVQFPPLPPIRTT